MALHDKNEKNDISHLSDCTSFEHFIEWCKTNSKVVTIVLSAMLFHTLILVGIVVATNSGNSTDIYVSEPPSQQASQPVLKPVEAPVYAVEENENSIEEDRLEESEDVSAPSSPYGTGVQTGELFIETRDAVTDFLQGFNEATGATIWARERWESGKERVGRWIDEHSTADETIIFDETDTDAADIE